MAIADVDLFTFTDWLLELIRRSPLPTAVASAGAERRFPRETSSAIEVTVPGPGNPSIDKVFRIRVEEA